jgi:hypothetical protein
MQYTKTQTNSQIISVPQKATVIISERAYKEMKIFCDRLPTAEWSAILFYKEIEGSIEDIDSLKIQVEYLWPMAKGTGASVSFEYDEDWIEVFDYNADAEDLKMGIVHSHNSMGVFHSGTDYQDLVTNASHYEYYLSLVVNNKMDFDAKIAICGEEEREYVSTYNFKKGLEKIIGAISPRKAIHSVIMVADCGVESTPVEIEIDPFMKRMGEVIQKEIPVRGAYNTYYKDWPPTQSSTPSYNNGTPHKQLSLYEKEAEKAYEETKTLEEFIEFYTIEEFVWELVLKNLLKRGFIESTNISEDNLTTVFMLFCKSFDGQDGEKIKGEAVSFLIDIFRMFKEIEFYKNSSPLQQKELKEELLDNVHLLFVLTDDMHEEEDPTYTSPAFMNASIEYLENTFKQLHKAKNII